MKTRFSSLALVCVLITVSLFISACSSESKPTKEELSSSFYELFIKQDPFAGLGDENVRNFSNCLAEEVYDDSSAKQLNAFVNADSVDVIDNEEIFDKEADERFGQAFETCQGQLNAELIPQSNSSFTQ